jgi:hypothetical protein
MPEPVMEDGGGRLDDPNLWKGIATIVPVQSSEQAPFLAGNVRINVAKALESVYRSAALVIRLKSVVMTGDASVLLDMPGEFFSLVISTLDAVREKMDPLTYVACVALSRNEEGLEDSELETTIAELLDNEAGEHFPWYLGLTKGLLETARTNYGAWRGIEKLRISLVSDGWAKPVTGDTSTPRIQLVPRNFTWGLS